MAHTSVVSFTATISVAPKVEHKTSKQGKDYRVVIFEVQHNSWDNPKNNPKTGLPYMKNLKITVAEEYLIDEVLAWQVGDTVELKNVINGFDKSYITVGFRNGATLTKIDEYIDADRQSLESQYSDAPF